MEFIIDKSKAEILDFFRSGINNAKLSDNKIYSIDFHEIKVVDDSVRILRKPKFTSAFRPLGKILIAISEISESETKLIGKAIPYNGQGHIFVIFIIIFLVLFTFGSLLISDDSNIILMIIIAWIMVAIGILLDYYITRSGLINYLNEIIYQLENEKKASR